MPPPHVPFAHKKLLVAVLGRLQIQYNIDITPSQGENDSGIGHQWESQASAVAVAALDIVAIP